jgi:hypothetical protein
VATSDGQSWVLVVQHKDGLASNAQEWLRYFQQYPCSLHYLKVFSKSCSLTYRVCIPGTPLTAHPLHYLEVSTMSCRPTYRACIPRDTPCSCAHWSTSNRPRSAAVLHVSASQGQPFSRAHCSTSKRPAPAAASQVPASQSHPFSLAHWSSGKGCCAAALHMPGPQGHPSRLNHCSAPR